MVMYSPAFAVLERFLRSKKPVAEAFAEIMIGDVFW